MFARSAVCSRSVFQDSGVTAVLKALRKASRWSRHDQTLDADPSRCRLPAQPGTAPGSFPVDDQ